MTYLRLSAAALGSALCLSAPANAQDQMNWCFEQARQMCGNYDIPLADCMSNYDLWPLVPNECVGQIQTMIEIENQTLYPPEAPMQDQYYTDNALGYSHGGILRSGPGMNFRKLASLQQNDWLEILEDTGVWFDGYKWFRVQSPMGTGYHWGGIFCVDRGQNLEGILNYCN